MKVRAKDFQAIIDGVIQVVGITFITGLNNQGKSSFVRSVHAAVCGRSGEDHVRHGQKKALVGIEFEEDPDNDPVQLAWIKGKGGAEYFLDGEPFSKLGRRGVPLEDLAKVGLREIEYSGGRSNLMFDLQDDPHFLVSQPPTQVFDYVSKVLQERKILPVVKVMAEDIKAVRDEAKILEGQIQTRKQSVQEWKTQREGLKKVLDQEDDFNQLREDLDKLLEMEIALDELASIQRECLDIHESKSKLDTLLDEATPLVEAYEQEGMKLEGMLFFRTQLRSDESEAACYEDDIRTLTKFLDSAPDLEKADKMVVELSVQRALLNDMENVLSDLRGLGRRLQKGHEFVSQAEEDLSRAELKYEQIKTEIGICPTCGSELT